MAKTPRVVLTPFEKQLQEKHLLPELKRVFVCAEFEDDRLHAEIVSPMPDHEAFAAAKRLNRKKKLKTMSAEIAALYDEQVLTREQEYHLFRKYNFLKYQARALMPHQDSVGVQLKVVRLLEEAIVVKQEIVRCNMRLAMNLAKTHASFAGQKDRLWEIFSHACEGIIRCVLCFNYTRGFKFGTYATWGLRNNMGRDTHRHTKYARNFVNESDYGYVDGFNDLSVSAKEETPEEIERKKSLTVIVNQLLTRLDRRSREIVQAHLLGSNQLTLRETGDKFNISRERVRQLKVKAINRMRKMVENDEVDLSDFAEEFVEH